MACHRLDWDSVNIGRLFSTLDAERTNLETYALGLGNGMQSIQLSSVASWSLNAETVVSVSTRYGASVQDAFLRRSEVDAAECSFKFVLSRRALGQCSSLLKLRDYILRLLPVLKLGIL
jgi:hypothetical protein